LFLLWWALALTLPPGILPAPQRVFPELVAQWQRPALWLDTLRTLVHVAASFLLALLFGMALGYAAYLSRGVAQALHPVMVVFEAAPTIAWLVLAILWVGLGSGPAILVGVSMALPLVYLATSHGLRQMDHDLIEMASVYRLPWAARVRHILLPALALTLAGVASGALSVCWRGVIMAEAFSATQGLGPELWGAYLYGEITQVYALIVWILILGLTLEYLGVHPFRRFVLRHFHADAAA